MARRVLIVRILIALFAIVFLNILFHYQLYGRHWHVLLVIPVVILLFFFLLDSIQKLIGALYPAKRWLRGLTWPLVFVGLLVVWWNQPYFGANVCLLTGFMRERDFVEEMRPTLLEIVERNMRRQQGVPPVGRAFDGAVATADRAIDLLKQCAGERGQIFAAISAPTRLALSGTRGQMRGQVRCVKRTSINTECSTMAILKSRSDPRTLVAPILLFAF